VSPGVREPECGDDGVLSLTVFSGSERWSAGQVSMIWRRCQGLPGAEPQRYFFVAPARRVLEAETA
jgi:hypothetical protein